jgi:hypothetical protein
MPGVPAMYCSGRPHRGRDDRPPFDLVLVIEEAIATALLTIVIEGRALSPTPRAGGLGGYSSGSDILSPRSLATRPNLKAQTVVQLAVRNLRRLAFANLSAPAHFTVSVPRPVISLSPRAS